ncbi:hypothetical protein HRbin10_01878 [bacterium HR10]|nr:hypothetical protein HRbin10_01878 [bacterium HR10]
MVTLEIAKKIATACEEKARELGIPMGIAVVDASGRLILSLRMDGASWITPEVARAKACAAAAFGMPTSQMREMAQAFPDFFAGLTVLTGGHFAAAGGGLPLRAGERIIGGLGVAGGPPELDEACAQAGVRLLEE